MGLSIGIGIFQPMLLLLVARCGDLAVSARGLRVVFLLRKTTEEADQVGAGPELEGQRKEESERSVKPGQVVPTGQAQIVGSGGKSSGKDV